MATFYAKTNVVNVFPSVHRGETSEELRKKSRLFTESNLVNLINQLTNKANFVITETYTLNGPLEFNIAGYYFKLNDTTELMNTFDSADVIYAGISLVNNELSGIDNQDSRYEGVVFSDIPIANLQTLKLLQFDVNIPITHWKIPADSRITIDGGEI